MLGMREGGISVGDIGIKGVEILKDTMYMFASIMNHCKTQ